jgi:uncharacterized protein (TIGR02597 family)
MSKQRTPVGNNPTGSTQRDNYVALVRPVAVTLDDSGLIASGAFSPSASPGTRIDELLVFDNTTNRQNKASSGTYYYFTNATVQAWRKVGSGTTNQGSVAIFTPGTGVILRKSASGAGAETIWVNTKTY